MPQYSDGVIAPSVTAPIMVAATSLTAGIVKVNTDGGFQAVTQTDGAGVGGGTLLTAPAAGNPHLWVPLKVGAVQGWFPWWHV